MDPHPLAMQTYQAFPARWWIPKGDLGFKLKMQHVGDRKTKSRNEITFKEFYNYRLSLRNNEFNPLFFSGPLTQ